MNTRYLPALVTLAVLAQPAAARQRQSPPPLPALSTVGAANVLNALRAGGYLLACRHALTDHDTQRSGPVDLNDRTTQRNLSRAGEEQARSLGRALRALGIPIGQVYSSPFARTMETAQLAFNRATPDAQLYGRSAGDARRARFNRRPEEGNTVLMTHQGILRSALGYRQPGEGDCVVVRPGEHGPEVVANVTVSDWQQLAATNGRET